MCQDKTELVVRVPPENRWAWKPIDSCIADIVKALQDGGINMRGSCCGHGKDFGSIILQDGRILWICAAPGYRSLKWAARVAWQIVRNWRKGGGSDDGNREGPAP